MMELRVGDLAVHGRYNELMVISDIIPGTYMKVFRERTHHRTYCAPGACRSLTVDEVLGIMFDNEGAKASLIERSFRIRFENDDTMGMDITNEDVRESIKYQMKGGKVNGLG